MRYALAFALLGLAGGWLAANPGPPLARVVAAATGVSFGLVAVGFALARPGVFLKRPDGRLHPLSWLLHWPYHLLNLCLFTLIRCFGREKPCDEIVDGVFLGRRLTHGDEALLARLAFRSTLDLTSEFTEHASLRLLPGYLCIPLLDTSAPSSEQLRKGVAFMADAPRPLLVHCAMGHGRSATFVAAHLLAQGLAGSVNEAEAQVRAHRPAVDLHDGQREALAAFGAKLIKSR